MRLPDADLVGNLALRQLIDEAHVGDGLDRLVRGHPTAGAVLVMEDGHVRAEPARA